MSWRVQIYFIDVGKCMLLVLENTFYRPEKQLSIGLERYLSLAPEK